MKEWRTRVNESVARKRVVKAVERNPLLALRSVLSGALYAVLVKMRACQKALDSAKKGTWTKQLLNKICSGLKAASEKRGVDKVCARRREEEERYLDKVKYIR